MVDYPEEVRAVFTALGTTPNAAPFVRLLVAANSVPLPASAREPALRVLDAMTPPGSPATEPMAQECFGMVWQAARCRDPGGGLVLPEAWAVLARLGLLQDAGHALVVAMQLASAAERYALEQRGEAPPNVQ